MKLTLLGFSTFMDMPDSVVNTEFGIFHETGEPYNQAERIAHFAGRSCYQSWHMPNPDTATDEGYIANIIKQQHFSVLEHAGVTFYVEGISRNMAHELIRHRHLSYSELSQRFVNMSEANYVIPPLYREHFGKDMIKLTETNLDYIPSYDHNVSWGKDRGATHKQSREAARALLPGATETKIVVTGNHRAWRDMLHKRYSVHADAEIREFATKVLEELRTIAPAIYQDFPDKPFS